MWWLVSCTTPPAPSGPPCERSGNICTWLGFPGRAAFTEEGRFRTETALYQPLDITFAPNGMAYYADFNNHRIRKVGRDGVVRDVAGGALPGDGRADRADCWDGCPAGATAWNSPTQVALDPSDPNRLWVASWANDRIVQIRLDTRQVYFWAGDREPYASDDGPRQQASFSRPSSLAVADDGTIFVSDSANQLVRRIDPTGSVSTIAGTPRQPGYSGDGGPATAARIHGPDEASRDPANQLVLDGDRLLFSDTGNGVVRSIELSTGTIRTIAGHYTSAGEGPRFDPRTGEEIITDRGSRWGYAGDGGPALDAVFAGPHDLALAADGTLYVVDTGNHCVRRIRPDGVLETFAGRCGESGFDGDRSPATGALLSRPYGVAIGSDGAVYIADTHNHVIRRVAP